MQESGMQKSPLQTVIEQKISQNLPITSLVVENFSHQHEGHAGYSPDGDSHFRIKVVSAAFEGLSKIDRQRLVYTLLSEELKEKIHALSLMTQTPQEAEKDYNI